jgi:hypothetical protein
MVNNGLNESMIDSGKILIQKLDERDISPVAAFWFYYPDEQQWKLILSEKNLDKIGPKEIYKKIQDTIKAHKSDIGALSLDDVALTKLDAPIIHLLRSVIRTGRELGSIRFSKNVIKGTMIDDAYIYRLN